MPDWREVGRRSVPAFPRTLLEFQRLFPGEGACTAYLEAVRWPGGFVCHHCNWSGEPWRPKRQATVLRCAACRRDTALTAGTIMHRTKTPLPVWFWGAYLVSTQTPGMSALQFQRQLGVKRYETAFQILHKLRAAMGSGTDSGVVIEVPGHSGALREEGKELPRIGTVRLRMTLVSQTRLCIVLR